MCREGAESDSAKNRVYAFGGDVLSENDGGAGDKAGGRYQRAFVRGGGGEALRAAWGGQEKADIGIVSGQPEKGKHCLCHAA